MSPRSAGQPHARQTKSRSKATSREKTGTFFEILKEDHRKVKELFSQIEDDEEMEFEERSDILSEISRELEAHMELEESYFYPVLKEHEETHEKALEAYEEHNIGRNALNELSKMGVDDERWIAKFKVLKELVNIHIAEEEKNVFRMAQKVIDRDQIQEITQRIEKEKSSIQA